MNTLSTHVYETQTELHLGRAITIYCIHDALHGEFWGWIVGTHIQLPSFRHASICRDDAKKYIDGRQR